MGFAFIAGDRRESKVGMVGEDINDAPSLTAADVAIEMGARGSHAALEQADVILMHDKIENVEQAVVLSPPRTRDHTSKRCDLVRRDLAARGFRLAGEDQSHSRCDRS